jgi:uncharacterized protein (TIGR02145 family)
MNMKTSDDMLSHFVTMVAFIFIAFSFASCEKEPELTIEESESLTDIDGNVYKTVKIDNRVYITENLNVSHFRNGDIIPEAKSKEDWSFAGTNHAPAWCYYNNDSTYGMKYGKLYNWYAVNDPRGILPEGWSILGVNEWNNLIDLFGGNKKAGSKLKSTTGWESGGNGDNSSRFSGLPGGGRYPNGDFADIGTAGIWWSSTENSAVSAWGYNMVYTGSGVLRGYFNKATGLSLRAVKLNPGSEDTTGMTLYEKLQHALDISVESGLGKGISATIILPDGTIWKGVSGISYGTTAITADMQFAAGSIGKMFTATAILQLTEEGLLNLDDSLYTWLPDYPYIDSTITIRQLLNHTSGLSDFADNPSYWNAIFQEPDKLWSLEDMIKAFNQEPVYPKGTGWNYSTVNYNLLRMILGKITGLELSSVYKNLFWIPLQLANTFTSMDGTIPANIAHSWLDLDQNGSYDDFSSWPRKAFSSSIGGEFWTTAEDLARWAKALFYDESVLTTSTLDQMLTFYSPCTGEEFFASGYGLGVAKYNPDNCNGLYAIGHSGNAPGYAAACIYLPDYKISIGIMDNTEEGESIAVAISRLITVLTDNL